MDPSKKNVPSIVSSPESLMNLQNSFFIGCPSTTSFGTPFAIPTNFFPFMPVISVPPSSDCEQEKKTRKRLPPRLEAALITRFNLHPYIFREEATDFAKQFGVERKRIFNWFENRRKTQKKKENEHKYRRRVTDDLSNNRDTMVKNQ